MYEDDSNGIWDWYFTRRPRQFFTLPVLFLLGLQVFYFAAMVPLVEIDLFLWNFLAFLFFGMTVGWLVIGIPTMVALIPIAALPPIWDAWKASSFVKAPAWLASVLVSFFVPTFIANLGFSLLEALGVSLRATGWWIRLWGG